MKKVNLWKIASIVVAIFFLTACKKSETAEEVAADVVDLNKNLLFSYDFSNSYKDASGKGLHLDSANSSGTAYTTDRNSNSNKAVLFSPNSYLTMPNSSTWKVQFPFTISMWVNVNDVASTNNRFFESDPITSNVYNGIWIHTTGTNGQVAFNFGSGSGLTRNTVITSQVLSNGGWHHLVAIYKGYNNITVYFDGQKDTGATYDGDADAIVYSSGRGHIGAFYGVSSYLDGKMDNVKMWSRALSKLEVEEEYASTK